MQAIIVIVDLGGSFDSDIQSFVVACYSLLVFCSVFTSTLFVEPNHTTPAEKQCIGVSEKLEDLLSFNMFLCLILVKLLTKCLKHHICI